jgi:hypothetical protein
LHPQTRRRRGLTTSIDKAESTIAPSQRTSPARSSSRLNAAPGLATISAPS